jgi:hypothetical protein
MQKIIVYLTTLLLSLFVLIQLNSDNNKVVNHFKNTKTPVKVSIASDQVVFDSVPAPTGFKTSEDTSKIAWNRWTADKFTIHSLDKKIGEYLYNNIQSVARNANDIWGLPNNEYKHEVRIFCCPSESILHKLFNINETSFEYKDDKKVIYVWLILNESNLDSLKSLITSVNLIELEHHYNYNFPLWVHRGMPLLSVSNDKTKESIKLASEIKKVKKIENLIELDYENYSKLESVSKKTFDVTSALFCLMIRKEFGQDHFHKCMLKTTNISNYLKYENMDAFNKRFGYYCAYLIRDYKNNKLNENYITITAKR